MVDKFNLQYPFQLDQVIINGRLFFEMINHYLRKYNEIKEAIYALPSLNNRSKEIFDIINNYENRRRIGDEYTRMLFDTALMYYVDKFGFIEINDAIFKIFIWSYSLRLKRARLQLATVDNYVTTTPDGNIFSLIKHALLPFHVLNSSSLRLVNNIEVKVSGVQEIVEFFKKENLIRAENDRK